MIRILVQWDDSYFVKAFGSYASAHCPNMEFLCFTTAEKAVEHLSRTGPHLDAVLAQQEVLDAVTRPNTLRLLCAEQTVFSDKDRIKINIYQPGQGIISDITSALALAGKGVFQSANGRAVHIAATYSVQGGSGKSVLSYALAAAAARSGHRVLYLNLEPFPALGQLYSHPFRGSIDNLLMALKTGRDTASALLDTMECNCDNVLVLPPFTFAGDLFSLSQENLNTLLRTLADKTDLEYIFVDLATGFQPLNLWMLELCSTVVQVYTDDASGREHLHRMQEDLYFRELPIQGVPLVVLNQSAQAGEEDVAAKIPFSNSLRSGKRVKDVLDCNPAFLKSCDRLLEKIV